MKTNDGGPAFPQNGSLQIGDMSYQGSTGITMRDYFAAKAMLGYMTSGFANFGNNHSVFAKDAYEMADAMLKERAK
jgi:hypothetical protein